MNRQMEQNLESIQLGILCSVLRSPVYKNVNLDIVFTMGISGEWFENQEYKSMFEVMRVLYNGGKEFDDAIILAYMEKSGVKNPQDIMLLVMAQSPLQQTLFVEYVAVLKESYARKMITILNQDVMKMLSDPSSRSDIIMSMMQAYMDKFIAHNTVSSTRRLSEVRRERKLKPPAERLETGVPFIDTVLTDKNNRKGIRNEGLFFISGLKQSGKTFILTRIIENISRHHPVMFGSMEFGEELYDENVEDQQEAQMFDGNIDNIFTFDSIYDVRSIASEIRLMHKLHGIRIAALDSMMRISNNNPDMKTDERRTSENFAILGRLSKELKIPIIIVVQSSKEDLKSSMISVKGSMNADHEAYVWFHLKKTNEKDPTDELRTVIWNKNKDTHKHPQQHLMFIPETSDFYRVTLDEHGNPVDAGDKYRKPVKKPIEVVYETVPMHQSTTPKVDENDAINIPMLDF